MVSLQFILFEIGCTIFYTNLHKLLCQFINWTNWLNSSKFMDNCWISCQIMADMKKVYNDLTSINLWSKAKEKTAIRLNVLLLDQNLMKNFRKIGSSFLDRLCGIWSPIPLEVRSCALRQSISTPPWQQQCSPNDCTMGSKIFYNFKH